MEKNRKRLNEYDVDEERNGEEYQKKIDWAKQIFLTLVHLPFSILWISIIIWRRFHKSLESQSCLGAKQVGLDIDNENLIFAPHIDVYITSK